MPIQAPLVAICMATFDPDPELRRLAGRNETLGIELSLLSAILWHRLAPTRLRRRRDG